MLASLKKAGWLITLTVLFSQAAQAQQPDLEERMRHLERQVELLEQRLAARDSAQIAELMRRIEALTREIEVLKLGQDVVVEAGEEVHGLGPAASKVYRVQSGVSIGGYGEVLYERFANQREDGSVAGKTDQFDALRVVIYVGYKFDDRFLFNSEIEVEHAATSNAGSVSVEFAYVDYLAFESIGFRAGLVLLPMGFLNEMHEPITFLGTDRPETELRIIPSTWRENGVGFFGEEGGFVYRGYVINGLDAIGGGTSDASGFSADGLRGGRQKGSKAVAEKLAAVGRLDYVRKLGLVVGASAYIGDSGQNNLLDPGDPAAGTIQALTLITEGHAQYKAYGWNLRGLIAFSAVANAAEINARQGFAGDESVGERLVGWYIEAGYDVLHRGATRQQLVPYVRLEQLNTQQKVPAGFVANPANDRRIVTIGAAWRPLNRIVGKADYQINSNEANTGVNQFNVSLGYVF